MNQSVQMSGRERLRVTVVVADRIARRGLGVMLDSVPVVSSVQVRTPARETPRLPHGDQCDVLVLAFADLGIELADRLARQAWRRGAKVLLVVDGHNREELDEVTVIPGDGFVTREELSTTALEEAITEILDGDTPMPTPVAQRLLAKSRADATRLHPKEIAANGALPGPCVSRVDTDGQTFGWDSLTDSEMRVVQLVADGLSNKQTADRLVLSQHTVDSHLRHVFWKLGINNRVQLARQYTEHTALETSLA